MPYDTHLQKHSSQELPFRDSNPAPIYDHETQSLTWCDIKGYGYRSTRTLLTQSHWSFSWGLWSWVAILRIKTTIIPVFED